MRPIAVPVVNRNLEKKIIIGISSWQLLIGIITVFFYAPYLKSNGFVLTQGSELDAASVQMLSNNLFTVAFTMGMLSIVLGCINFYLAKILKPDVSEKKIPIWFIICAGICFFMMDIISVGLLITVSILLLAKNKAIKVNHERMIHG